MTSPRRCKKARFRNLRLSDLARALADGTETHVSLTARPRSEPDPAPRAPRLAGTA